MEFHLIQMRRCDVQSFLLSILQPLTLPSSPLTSPPPFNEVAQLPDKKLSMLIHIILFCEFGKASFELQNMDFFRVFLASGLPNPPSRQDGARPGSSKEKPQRAQAGARDRRPQSDPLPHLHLLRCCHCICQHNFFITFSR